MSIVHFKTKLISGGIFRARDIGWQILYSLKELTKAARQAFVSLPISRRIIIIALGSSIVLVCYSKFAKSYRLSKGASIPGPFSLPIIGSLDRSAFSLFELGPRLYRKYGNIAKVRFLGQDIVVISGYDLINEALVKYGDSFAGKPDIPIKLINEDNGLIRSDGELWRVHRRFTLSTLRDLGLGRNILEQLIVDEADLLVQRLEEETTKASCGGPKVAGIDPELIITQAINNIVSNLVFGERFGEDPEFVRRMEVVNQFLGILAAAFSPIPHWATKLMFWIPGMFSTLKKMIQLRKELMDYLQKKIDARRQKIRAEGLGSSGGSECYVDAYLIEAENEEKTKRQSTLYFHDKQLKQSILEMWLAGTDTTVSTLRWLCFLLAKYPEAQERVRGEVESVVGSKTPASRYRAAMPYSEAVLCEAQRVATTLPISQNKTVSEVVLTSEGRPYLVPKDAIVAVNLLSVHRDPTLWRQPLQRFQPENFFDSATNTVKNADYLIPFSLGKRSCLGESLVRQELFIFLVRLLQTFRIHLDNPDGPIPEDDELAPFEIFVRIPRPFKLRFVKLDQK